MQKAFLLHYLVTRSVSYKSVYVLTFFTTQYSFQVKGKSFVKEMQKKKRASWRGGGQIDTKINSYIYPDSD